MVPITQREVQPNAQPLCPHRFHDKKAKKDLVYVHRYLRSKAKVRQRSWKRRFRRLHDRVCRLERIAASLLKPLAASENFLLRGLGAELKHYLPLVRTICRTAGPDIGRGSSRRWGGRSSRV